MTVFYTRHAQSDLQGIYEYIAYVLASSIAAKATTRRIMQGVRSLESMPERNPLYKDEPWCSQGVRVLSVKNYLIFYTVNKAADTVAVARIIYGGRDLSLQLEETSEWK